MVRDYLNALKNKGNFKFSELSNLSGVPEATIRKIFTGETPDPRFDTVAKLVSAMGGTLDDAFSTKKEKDIEANVVTELKANYEIHIENLRERIADMNEAIEFLKRDRKILGIITGILVAVLVLLLVFDIAIGSHGWVQY